MTHGLTVRPAVDGVLGQQGRAEHHRRVRGVGAAGDRGDHDGAVVELELAARRPSVTVRRLATGGPSAPSAAENTTGAASSSAPLPGAGGSLAGKDSSTASSTPTWRHASGSSV